RRGLANRFAEPSLAFATRPLSEKDVPVIDVRYLTSIPPFTFINYASMPAHGGEGFGSGVIWRDHSETGYESHRLAEGCGTPRWIGGEPPLCPNQWSSRAPRLLHDRVPAR